MSTITVNQASEYTHVRDANRVKQTQVKYSDLVIYAEVLDFDELSHCNAIHPIEEWTLDTNNGENGDFLLLIQAEADKNFIMQSWFNSSEGNTPTVVETPLSKSAFEQLKRIGVRGFNYTRNRYDIAYTPNAWFVDIFKDKMGENHPWVRLTLSCQDEFREIPKIPFPIGAYVFEQDPTNSPDQQEKIRNLWSREWLTIETA